MSAKGALADVVPVSGAFRSRPVAVRVPGDVIAGKYTLRRMLGRGGMGSVWHAKNLTLGTDVAIKLILPSVVVPEAGERLFREARAAALLEHPGIVRVFDFGWSERQEPFIVMELLRGSTLGALLAARLRLPAELAVQLLLPVAGALSFAHACGIVHRDLKPDNVMLVTAPQRPVVPKLVDFGIAKLLREDGLSLTREGAILGSPHYMAPEQASGAGDVDERADIWALCVVLYEAITGFRPFERDGRYAPLAVFVEEPVPVTAVGAGDDALWAILRRGLEVAPERRWPSMQALGAALAEWALARRIGADVTGSCIDHLWRSPDGCPSWLDLPEPRPRPGTETTEWAAPVPAPWSPGESTVAGPPPVSLARRLWPVLSLALVAAGLVLLRAGWIHKDNNRLDPVPAAVASRAPAPAPVEHLRGEDGKDIRSPAITARPAEPEAAAHSSSGPVAPPPEAPPAPPPRRLPAGMPLPTQPNF